MQSKKNWLSWKSFQAWNYQSPERATTTSVVIVKQFTAHCSEVTRERKLWNQSHSIGVVWNHSFFIFADKNRKRCSTCFHSSKSEPVSSRRQNSLNSLTLKSVAVKLYLQQCNANWWQDTLRRLERVTQQQTQIYIWSYAKHRSQSSILKKLLYPSLK